MRTDLWSILEPVPVDPARKSWKDVLRNLVFHANIEGLAWPSVATIREETGYKSDKAVIAALAGLRAAGIISPTQDSPAGGGRGKTTRWSINDLSKNVDKLKTTRGMAERDTVQKGEVTSPFVGIVNPDMVQKGEVTSKKGEVTSKKGEVTSARIYNRNKKEVSELVCMGQKGELTSPFVDNSPKSASAEGAVEPQRTERAEVAPSARNDVAANRARGKGEPRQMRAEDLFPDLRPDYLALCSRLGWRPNDPKQTPAGDADLARRAIVTCAYREGLSPSEAKRFLTYNAKTRWKAIDQANCVKDLAKEFCEAWRRRDNDAYWDEIKRRRDAERKRAAAKGAKP